MSIEMRPPKNKSSHIHSLGFDAETGTMAVQFHKGGVYHYHGVPQSTFDELHGHDSPGSHLRAAVVGKYKHSKR